MSKAIALVPARAGSLRVKNKNIRVLNGHPLIAYAITSALESGIFQSVVVSTDSELIADVGRHYGAQAPFLRPAQFATSVSPDIEWIKHVFGAIKENYDAFTILRPTSPFRTARTIKRAWERFLSLPGIDSLRAVELCRQHPGKMWVVEGDLIRPLLDQSKMEVAWHAGQYQALPKVYVQNSSLEIAWTRVIREHNSREGKVVAPFFTEKIEGFSIDYEDDFAMAEHMLAQGEATLQPIQKRSFDLNLLR